MSTVTGIAGVTVAILVTVDVFGLSDDVVNSKMSTGTGIAEGRVAILVTVDVFGLSHLLEKSKKYRHVVSCSALLGLACECGAINMSGGVGGLGGAQPSQLQNIE